MPKTSIQAAGGAVPANPSIIMGATTPESVHRLTVDELRMLSMEELRTMVHLIQTIDEVVSAFLNQGRFSSGDAYNKAGSLADGLLEHFSWCISMIEEVAKDARPATTGEARHRAWLLIQRAAHYSENLADFVAFAAQLSVEASEVEAV